MQVRNFKHVVTVPFFDTVGFLSFPDLKTIVGVQNRIFDTYFVHKYAVSFNQTRKKAQNHDDHA